MPLVFSSDEIRASRTAELPARQLCIGFCVKEAVHKALGELFDYTECEVFEGADPGVWPEQPVVRLGTGLRRAFGVDRAVAAIFENGSDPNEIAVAVYLVQGGAT